MLPSTKKKFFQFFTFTYRQQQNAYEIDGSFQQNRMIRAAPLQGDEVPTLFQKVQLETSGPQAQLAVEVKACDDPFVMTIPIRDYKEINFLNLYGSLKVNSYCH